MGVYTTEIASDKIQSDNPIHQRLYKPYQIIASELGGKVLEIGCGEGRGIALMIEKAEEFHAIDKIQEVIDKLQLKFPLGHFQQMNIPPLSVIPDNTFDYVVSFQVIEHIKDDSLYLTEINRVLKPGGKVFITTPILMIV